VKTLMGLLAERGFHRDPSWTEKSDAANFLYKKAVLVRH
jgi:hypothetical protein